MKKSLILLFTMALPLLAMAQNLKIGFFSYETLLKGMPEYVTAMQNVATLRAQYDADADRSTKEFNAKYEQFLAEQKDLAPSIRTKRQVELQSIMQRNAAFKLEADRLLTKAQAEAVAPAKAKLDAAIRQAGIKAGFAAIINTDNNGVPFINPAWAEDATLLIKNELLNAQP